MELTEAQRAELKDANAQVLAALKVRNSIAERIGAPIASISVSETPERPSAMQRAVEGAGGPVWVVIALAIVGAVVLFFIIQPWR